MNTESIEQYLKKIHSVVGSKIVVNDTTDEIEEIHILSGFGRNPKQIIRDVQAILLTKFNLSIDYKKISIAQIKEDMIEDSIDCRLKLSSVDYHNEGSRGTVKVILQKDDDIFEHSITGINTVNNLRRLVGNAVLRVIEQYNEIEQLLNLEDVRVINISNLDVVVVIVSSLIKGQEQVLAGTAIVKHDINEAIARATLDSVNRIINQVHIY